MKKNMENNIYQDISTVEWFYHHISKSEVRNICRNFVKIIINWISCLFWILAKYKLKTKIPFPLLNRYNVILDIFSLRVKVNRLKCSKTESSRGERKRERALKLKLDYREICI